MPLETYASARHGGSFLVIHPADGSTLAAGIVRDREAEARAELAPGSEWAI